MRKAIDEDIWDTNFREWKDSDDCVSIEQCKELMQDARDNGIRFLAQSLHERITRYGHSPIDALNDLFRDHGLMMLP